MKLFTRTLFSTLLSAAIAVSLLPFGGCAQIKSAETAVTSYVKSPAFAAGNEAVLQFVGKSVLSIAENTAINAAVDALDKNSKANTLDGMAEGLRTQAEAYATSISGADIAQIIEAYAPNDGAVWQSLGTQVGDVVASAASGDKAAAIEAAASALNTAAESARASLTATPSPTPDPSVP